jgi:hypothetical protein
MLLNRLLRDSKLEPEEIALLNLAFTQALRMLCLVDRKDCLCELVAKKIIEVGATGIREPSEIARVAIKKLGAIRTQQALFNTAVEDWACSFVSNRGLKPTFLAGLGVRREPGGRLRPLPTYPHDISLVASASPQHRRRTMARHSHPLKTSTLDAGVIS